MKKYYILLSGLCFAQIQGMGSVEPTQSSSSPQNTPPSLATLALRSYRQQVVDTKVQFEDIEKLFPSTQEIIRDEILKDKAGIDAKNYAGASLFPVMKLEHATRVTAVAFSVSGKYFAIGEESGRITIYNRLGEKIKSFMAPCVKDAPPAITHLDLSRLNNNFILVSKFFQAPQLLDIDGNLLVSYDEKPKKEKSFLELYLEAGHYAYRVIQEGHLENNYPPFILDILKNFLPRRWKFQDTLIARFSSDKDYIFGSNLYQDKDCSLFELNHHYKEPHRHKSLHVWNINGPEVGKDMCDISEIEDNNTINVSMNIKMVGSKRLIKENDLLSTINLTGEFALSVHKNKVYLQYLMLGTMYRKPQDFELYQLLFMDKSWNRLRALGEARHIRKDQLEEEKKLKKGCFVS